MNLPKQEPGRPIAARTINAASGLAERLARMRAGRGMRQASVDGVPVFEVDGPGTAFFKTPSGGIPAMSSTTPGSADCERYLFNGTSLVATGATEKVYCSTTGTAVAGNIVVQAKVIDNHWFVDVESCP